MRLCPEFMNTQIKKKKKKKNELAEMCYHLMERNTLLYRALAHLLIGWISGICKKKWYSI